MKSGTLLYLKLRKILLMWPDIPGDHLRNNHSSEIQDQIIERRIIKVENPTF